MKKAIIVIFCFLGAQQSIKAQTEIDSAFLLSKSRLFIIPTFSVSNRIAENDQQLIRLVDDQYRLEWEVDMNVGYFVKDNFSVGAQLSYSQAQEEITFTQDNKQTTQNSFGHTVTFSPNIRNYYGPGRLKVFNQTGLIFQVGDELKRIYNEEDEDKIRSKVVEFGIGIQPGLAFFFDRIASVEASINLLGWTTRIEESIKNDVEKSRVVTNDVNFSINVLSLKIGIGIYLNDLIKK